jgi:hypothetical protein
VRLDHDPSAATERQQVPEIVGEIGSQFNESPATRSRSRVAVGAASDDQRDEEGKVDLSLRIAPVPLNMSGKNRELVGLGSHIVNA